ncbi:restriction endonuclease subunit S [Microcoleus sp. S36b_A4]|uniref:restriction endonuclease subunit S n=1 Tax=Microcoleus sp. S36b_A4 TaxID=3055420 RepID=UPI002FD2E081
MSRKANKTYYSVSQLCEVIDCEHKTAPYVDFSEYLVVRTSNVRNGALLFDDIKYTTKEGFIEWTQRAVPEHGDVLFTREAPAGETCLVPPSLKICMGQRMVLLRPNKNLINPHFLSFYLTTKQCRREIYEYVIGSTVTRINIDDILKIKIFCPSIAEQEKIASFLGAVDTRLTQLRRKHELLQTYKRGVMQKLFSQQIRFKCDRGKPFPDWEKKKLGSITKIYDGTHQTPNYVSKGVPFYSVEHLTSNNFTDTKLISEEVFIQENKRVCLEKGDILMTRIGDIGTCRLIDWDVRASFYVSLALIKSNKIAISGFLTYFMSSIYFQRELHKRTIHVAFPKKINLGEIGNCRIAIPCIKEQEKIADFLTAIDQKIEAVAKQIELTEQFKKGLLQKMFV